MGLGGRLCLGLQYSVCEAQSGALTPLHLEIQAPALKLLPAPPSSPEVPLETYVLCLMSLDMPDSRGRVNSSGTSGNT